MSSLHKAKVANQPSIIERIRALFAQPKLALVGVVSLCLLIAVVIPKIQQNQNIQTARTYRSDGGISLTGGTVDIDGLIVDATNGPVHVEKGHKLAIPRGSRVNMQFADGSIITASRHAKI